ncbi:hypothetical protein H9P43_006836 [Blastocladiella emersonii ATCC 22665]|nr:hypothetical protein H9P43_006836 [Blastocladiella emersonii ATCC 22665]
MNCLRTSYNPFAEGRPSTERVAAEEMAEAAGPPRAPTPLEVNECVLVGLPESVGRAPTSITASVRLLVCTERLIGNPSALRELVSHINGGDTNEAINMVLNGRHAVDEYCATWHQLSCSAIVGVGSPWLNSTVEQAIPLIVMLACITDHLAAAFGTNVTLPHGVSKIECMVAVLRVDLASWRKAVDWFMKKLAENPRRDGGTAVTEAYKSDDLNRLRLVADAGPMAMLCLAIPDPRLKANQGYLNLATCHPAGATRTKPCRALFVPTAYNLDYRAATISTTLALLAKLNNYPLRVVVLFCLSSFASNAHFVLHLGQLVLVHAAVTVRPPSLINRGPPNDMRRILGHLAQTDVLKDEHEWASTTLPALPDAAQAATLVAQCETEHQLRDLLLARVAGALSGTAHAAARACVEDTDPSQGVVHWPAFKRAKGSAYGVTAEERAASTATDEDVLAMREAAGGLSS